MAAAKEKPIPASVNFGLAAVAGCSGWMFVHPFDVVKTRMQTNEGKSLNPFRVCAEVGRKEGLTGLYSGLSAGLMRQCTYTMLRVGLFNNLTQYFKDKEDDEDDSEEDKDGDEPATCCEEMTAECLACKAGKDVRKYCRQNPGTDGCDAIRDKRKKRRKSRDNEEDDADDSQDKRKNKRKSKDKEDDEDDSEEDKDGDEPATCCEEMTAECLACKAGKDVRKYCKQNPGTDGCDAIKDKRKKRRKSRDNDEDDEDDSEDKRKEKKRSKDKEEDDEDDFEEDKDGNEPASQD
eukprot:TRINITY_DN12564_c0_g1_i12.p1 TRINITY_DN12564_c0_g1~~TRINITY_DN12564_c0_g1_i12.p1  ORF type:complete len:291 (-),score=81.49 TRINITY_DN12564_c0_g1_i12:64-936(-)